MGMSFAFRSGPLYYLSYSLMIGTAAGALRMIVTRFRSHVNERQQMRDIVRYSETGAGRLTRSSARVWAAGEEPQQVQ